MNDIFDRQDLKYILELIMEHVDYKQTDTRTLALIETGERISEFLIFWSKKQEEYGLNIRACDDCRLRGSKTVERGSFVFELKNYTLTYVKCEKCRSMFYFLEHKEHSVSLLQKIKSQGDPEHFNYPEQVTLVTK